MSNTATNNLTEERIQQLLAAVGVESEEDTKYNIDAFDYNWHQLNYFNNNQLKEVELFAEKVAKRCAERFTHLYNSDFSVTIDSTAQRFANEIFVPGHILEDYYLTIGTQEQNFGLIGIPEKTAMTWATELLGETNAAENPDRDLSQLERSLLFDIAVGIVNALSDSSDDYDLQSGSEITYGKVPIELNGTEEFCKITFCANKVDAEESSSAYFLIFCDKLQAIMGQKAEANENISDQEISKAIMDHVLKTPVCITAKLASAVLTFEEIMSLQVDDILLLDKMVGEPTELVVGEKTLFLGQPVKSDGKHAVLITELADTK